jgi:predicted NodU family carbamoyl transferase
MIVLGINDGHDSGVCLLQDGRVLMCSSEERRVKVKDLPGVPVHCIASVEGVDWTTVARV